MAASNIWAEDLRKTSPYKEMSVDIESCFFQQRDPKAGVEEIVLGVMVATLNIIKLPHLLLIRLNSLIYKHWPLVLPLH